MEVVHLICAARPNFMKVAPLYHALKKTDWCRPVIVLGQQHYDDNMSTAFLRDLGLPAQHLLGIGSGTHAEQTAQGMTAYEELCSYNRPDAIVVPGDVNTTMACALVGAKLDIPIVHLEAGLRSYDRSMPEEINRIVTDAVSNLLLTPSPDADHNLMTEGVPADQICRVGNIMIDAFEMLRPRIEAVPLRKGPYAVVTLHRPSNVDDPVQLRELLDNVWALSKQMLVVFPVHPRTRKRIDEQDVNLLPNVELHAPMPYVEFMALVKNAAIVITDSGGVQEETSYLGVPCATVRENTERPVTVTQGTNALIKPSRIVDAARDALTGRWKKGRPIPLWDGKTAGRCVQSLYQFLHH